MQWSFLFYAGHFTSVCVLSLRLQVVLVDDALGSLLHLEYSISTNYKLLNLHLLPEKSPLLIFQCTKYWEVLEIEVSLFIAQQWFVGCGVMPSPHLNHW